MLLTTPALVMVAEAGLPASADQVPPEGAKPVIVAELEQTEKSSPA